MSETCKADAFRLGQRCSRTATRDGYCGVHHPGQHRLNLAMRTTDIVLAALAHYDAQTVPFPEHIDVTREAILTACAQYRELVPYVPHGEVKR